MDESSRITGSNDSIELDSPDFVEDSMNLSDKLPAYSRSADRSRSFLERLGFEKDRSSSNKLRQAILRNSVGLQNKDFRGRGSMLYDESNLSSTPKRDSEGSAKLLDMSPIVRSDTIRSRQKKAHIDDSDVESISADEDPEGKLPTQSFVVEDNDTSAVQEFLSSFKISSDSESAQPDESDSESPGLDKQRSHKQKASSQCRRRTAYIVSSEESSDMDEALEMKRRNAKLPGSIEKKTNALREFIVSDESSAEVVEVSDVEERSKVVEDIDGNEQPETVEASDSDEQPAIVEASDNDEQPAIVDASDNDEQPAIVEASDSDEESQSIVVLDSSSSSQEPEAPPFFPGKSVGNKGSTISQFLTRPAADTGKLLLAESKGLSNNGPSRGPQIIPAPHLNPEEYNRLVSAKPVQRLFGGKMTTDRLDVAKAVTGDIVSKMHRAVSGAPAAEKRHPTPEGLLTELMDHQKYALAWMLWREKETPPGGILADDMGLGKTLSFIALIVQQLEEAKNRTEEEIKLKRKAICDNFLVPSDCTLIIVPASLIYQWEAEIKKHVKDGLLNIYIFHGPKQKREANPKRLARYDVVLTTYNTVTSELSEKVVIDDSEGSSDDSGPSNGHRVKPKQAPKKTISSGGSVLTKVAWARIILDEAHQIKNKTALVSKACCKIPGICRWCASGTPIHNKLWDLFSLFRFLRVRPFDEEAVWKEYIMGCGGAGSQRLNTLVKGLLLRREKSEVNVHTGRPIIELKEKKHEDIQVELCGLEKKVYELMFLASKQKVKQLIEQNGGIIRRNRKWDGGVKVRNPFLDGPREVDPGDNFQTMSSVLTILLRLRQACVHMALTKHAVDMDAFEGLDAPDGEGDHQLADLTKNLANMSIVDEEAIAAELIADNIDADVAAIFETTFDSAKISALLKRMDSVLANGDKCVIVSQWTSLLSIVEERLIKRRTEYTCITGKVLPKNRQPCVDSFNEKNGGARVMLLSLTAGGVGLNLVGGNHLFLLDLHWNPAIEQQACDRIYRMGQKKNVFIHKFICQETIEQKVLCLQEAKKTLAKSVLEGASSKKLTKLTMNDIKYLFELNPGANRPQVPKTAPTGFQPASSLSNFRIPKLQASNSAESENAAY